MEQVKFAIAAAPLVLLAACSSADQSAKKEAEPVAAVRTAAVETGATLEEIAVYGAAETEPGNEHGLATQAEATVLSINAPTGTAVGAGQVIAVLSPTATARLDAAKAASDVTLANAALARALRLRTDGLVSNAEVETARAALQSAIATRASVSQRNGTLVLRAPVSGTVENLTAKAGDFIAAGTTVATIGKIGDLRARFGIEPALAARIRTGLPIKLLPTGSDGAINTSIIGVHPQADPVTRLASVYARIPSGSGLGAGQSIKASIAIGGTSNAITIPYSALLDDGGQSYVFVVIDGEAKKREVTPGSSAGDRIQIISGLRAGERVVTEGGTALEDGMKVREEGSAAPKGAK